MNSSRLTLALACGASAFLAASPAFAQATRTWISGIGDDANPCSRFSPCKSFAGAINKTAAGGEIDVLDAGDFGPVTITKALTLSGQGGLGAALAVGASAVTISAGPADVVVLRRLALQGSGSGSDSGISFRSGKALHVEDCTVAGFPGDGIHFESRAGGQLVVAGVRASGNSGAGVFVASGGDAAQVTVTRSSFERNGFGILARDGGKVAVYDSVVSGSGDTGIAALPLSAGPAEVNLEGVTLSADGVGLRAEGATALIRLSKVTVLDPITDASRVAAGGRLLSFGNNRLLGLVAGDLCTGVTCPAPNGCQLPGVCDHFTGTCQYPVRPDETACDDGEACTRSDTCRAGACVGGGVIDCAEADECRAGSCNPESGACQSAPKPDGTVCSSGTCVAGVCAAVDAGLPPDASQGGAGDSAEIPSTGCGCAASGDSWAASLALGLLLGGAFAGGSRRRGRRGVGTRR